MAPNVAMMMMMIGSVLIVMIGMAPDLAEARCGSPELPPFARIIRKIESGPKIRDPDTISNFDQEIMMELSKFYEEGDRVVVGCDHGGAIAYRVSPSPLLSIVSRIVSNEKTNFTTTTPTGTTSSPISTIIDSVASIECLNSRWNASALRCLRMLHPLSNETIDQSIRLVRNVRKSKLSNVDAEDNDRSQTWHRLFDGDASTCVDFDFDSNDMLGKHPGKETPYNGGVHIAEMKFRFETKNSGLQGYAIPRIAVVLRDTDDLAATTSASSSIHEEHKINIDKNSFPSSSSSIKENGTGEKSARHDNNNITNTTTTTAAVADDENDNNNMVSGNVEVEESKRFLDFVYESEFTAKSNHTENDTNAIHMMLLRRRNYQQRKKAIDLRLNEGKLIRTAKHDVMISISLGDEKDNDDDDDDDDDDDGAEIRCAFNSEAEIAESSLDIISAEILIFDCEWNVNDDNADADRRQPQPQRRRRRQQRTRQRLQSKDFENNNGNNDDDEMRLARTMTIRLEIRRTNDSAMMIDDLDDVTFARATAGHDIARSRSGLRLCSIDVWHVAPSSAKQCGEPYVPIYGVVRTEMRHYSNNNHKQNNGNDDDDDLRLVAEYSCLNGYKPINVTEEYEKDYWSPSDDKEEDEDEHESNRTFYRQCSSRNSIARWTSSLLPSIASISQDIVCVPIVSCRRPPPLPDRQKFYYEYSRLDLQKRAIANVSLATLRCQQLTDYVSPLIVFRCSPRGEWIRITAAPHENDVSNFTIEFPQIIPICRTSPVIARANRRRIRPPNYYYHHHYHHYRGYGNIGDRHNRTSIYIFGRQLNDNKCLIYYGAALLALLFGGSFITLFHVRRMAKKLSYQMRERSYMSPPSTGGAGDKMAMSNDAAFTAISGSGGQLPPYYGAEIDDIDGYGATAGATVGGNNSPTMMMMMYDGNATLFSNDLPPPATPLSMPCSDLDSKSANTGYGNQSSMNRKPNDKHSSSLAANFDSIKF